MLTNDLVSFLWAFLVAFVMYMAMKMMWKRKKHIAETPEEHGFRDTTEEHEVTDTKYLCVGIVDISNSDRVTANIREVKKVAKYYCTFINTMEAIARNFGAEVVKNVGDTVIFFFPKTSETSSDNTPFKDVLKCGLAMQAAHDDMNKKYYEEHLPPINYKISADYGKTEVTKSKDVFGSTVNMCAKIHNIAPPNGMVIGKNLYDMINDSFEGDYNFTKIHEYPPDKDPDKTSYPKFLNPYSVYLISG